MKYYFEIVLINLYSYFNFRIDRNELVKERALAEMPDLKLVSVPNSSKVIVNDLSSKRSNKEKETEKKLSKHSNHLVSSGE